MKKIVLTMAVALLSTVGVMAQDENGNPEMKQPSKSEMVQHRTEMMVKRYELNENQTAQLQELNEKYADMIMAAPHRGMGHRSRGMRPGNRGDRHHMDSLNVMQQRDSAFVKRPRREEGRRPDFEKMRKTMEAYNNELKDILTAEQYAAYEADREKMMQRRAPRSEERKK